MGADGPPESNKYLGLENPKGPPSGRANHVSWAGGCLRVKEMGGAKSTVSVSVCRVVGRSGRVGLVRNWLGGWVSQLGPLGCSDAGQIAKNATNWGFSLPYLSALELFWLESWLNMLTMLSFGLQQP